MKIGVVFLPNTIQIRMQNLQNSDLNLLCPENPGGYLHETLVEAQIVPDGVLPALVGLQLVVGELLLDPLVDVGQGCLDSSLRGSINRGGKYEVC